MATTLITAPVTTATLLDTSAMASKRMPLASVPNAVNSPYRSTTKRTRAQAGDTKELILEQPPAKKQLLDNHDDDENIDPQTRADRYFLKRAPNAPVTALERKLAASREKKPVSDQRTRHNAESLESIRQWQKHYRRQFPHFVFYFDGTPDDVRVKLVRQLQALGSREEKFFSSVVTHVVTTRQIPPEVAKHYNEQGQTVAPSALFDDHRKVNSLLENTLERRNIDIRRVPSQAADVLSRARELNIKIWALEKVQRVLKTMFEAVTGEQGVQDARPAAMTVDRLQPKTRDADLEQLLRNEKINGPADRDATVAAQDMVTLKGCYLYIHDMDEKTRPVMVRDYAKPPHRDEGKWPQFRVSGIGRCPFVEDPAELKLRQDGAGPKTQRRTKTTDAVPQPLAERASNLRRSPRKMNLEAGDVSKPLDPPKLVPTKRSITDEAPVFASTHIAGRGPTRMIGGMPIASGIQHSNVTSAIRSQIVSSAAISSTAPGMGRRVPDSKEVSVLKRKVLERTASVPSQPPSSYLNDMRAAINDESGPPPRAAKRRAQENLLGAVPEDEEAVAKMKKKAAKKAKAEPKPGYCENCKDKFDDFDEHCTSRKHQRFARTADNWKDLDDLLRRLKRTHKEH